ncbi:MULTISPECIES: NAD(P)-dependent oxidoreductase [Vibrio]|jgi:precorrin-2 dehydrogenase/sirohydrochlorin ferrochelatase|uniref:precorrin-2 dehydrogenase n=1 Tax=Vibrio jasicida TaxID=766224 RepID=A0ABW7J468_9VIBR|nr:MULTISPECIES: NAD(P)-dependent oxidoreductase [Vibrio]MCF6453436.1 siroheme synthase [Vibrio sp. MMG023]MCX2792129.1 siroheme synthase [Vibrio sp. Sgm 5]PQJ65737.1 siroheme synthase [Vibrio jasicida]CAH1534386.1 Siroheme synthase / Precorrin-2 oxidase [Vibrio jasicida]CAH1608535.1 Siroheme synthase / Precorrin-2 oxidase [Vibrio jasicida]
MRYFPLFLDLVDKPVLVVGGGEVASRKVEALLKAGADVTIVSPSLVDFLDKLAQEQQVRWIQRFYSSDIVTKSFIQVWATTDNPELNHQVYKDAKELGILVNVVDDKPYCDFITPSMINRGRIQIAISSGGASPVLIRNIREKLEAILPQNMGLMAEFANSKRNSIKEALPSVDLRRKFWESYFSHPEVENARDNRELEIIYQQTMAKPLDEEGSCTWIQVGQDVEMLPIKAVRYMQQAELALYSTMCEVDVMELVRRDAEREPFRSATELSDMLTKARKENLRVCVFVPSGTSEFSLLQGQDLVI